MLIIRISCNLRIWIVNSFIIKFNNESYLTSLYSKYYETIIARKTIISEIGRKQLETKYLSITFQIICLVFTETITSFHNLAMSIVIITNLTNIVLYLNYHLASLLH